MKTDYLWRCLQKPLLQAILPYRKKTIVTLIAICSTHQSSALILRDGDAADNVRFTGFPTNPVASSTFIHSSYNFTGIGWYVQDTQRQFALISPQHFVCATHFRPSVGRQVRFLGSDGTPLTYDISRTEIITNAAGANTDLTLGTLSTPIDTRFISRMKVANFASDASYAGPGIVFGRTIRAGNTTLGAITDFNGVSLSGSVIDNTRMINLVYQNSGGNVNDASLQGGDSGSPSFIIFGDEVGLVGTNSAVINTGLAQNALAAFVPFYQSDLNNLMQDEGYRISPLVPLSTTITLDLPGTLTLRQGQAGNFGLSLTNTGAVAAGNISLTLQNATTSPSNFSSSGYLPGLVTSTSNEIHKASLSASASETIQVEWDTLPTNSMLEFEVVVQSDESGTETHSFSIPLLPSFALFTGGLIDRTIDGDDDGDGINNLLEYAFGGDPTTTSTFLPSGELILPTFETSPTGGNLSYLRRTNATERALSYTVESSDDLSGSSWSTLPSTTEETTTIAGTDLEQVSVSIPTSPTARRFYRVVVVLDE